MSDLEFIGYVELHVLTDVAEFSAYDLRRAYAMADEPFPEPNLPSTAFRSLDRWEGERLANKARARLKCPRYAQCASGAARTQEALQ